MNRLTQEQLPEAFPVFVSQFQTIYPAIDRVRKEMVQLRGRSFVIMEFSYVCDGHLHLQPHVRCRTGEPPAYVQFQLSTRYEISMGVRSQ